MTDTFDQSTFDEIFTAFEYAAELVNPANSIDWTPLPHFQTPPLPWTLWLLFGGRGSGKTAHAAKYVHDHVHGPPCLPGVPGGHWVSIVAPTLGDAVTSCIEGPSGLRAHDPGIKTLTRPGGIIARWSNGTEAKLFGAHSPEDVERFRAGGNRCLVWMEEAAAWRYLEECYAQIRFGLRSGPRPHAIASTTPRSKKLIKRWVEESKEAGSKTIVSHGKMTANPHLIDDVKEELVKEYGGTRLGRQELDGELLEDVEGALWTGEVIDEYRIDPRDCPKDFDRVIVSIDPAASEGGDEHGIVVVGIKRTYMDTVNIRFPELSHGFVLDDRSTHGSPNRWGKQAIAAYKQWKADCMTAEVNNGGDMVINVILGLDDGIPVIPVHATRGKARRAEPVANLYDQGRVHHVGMFAKLEDQMTTWDAADPDESWSPDRMDALVWAITEGMLAGPRQRTTKSEDKRLKGRR
jgi:phage terminase large subunit-like protein